MSSLKRIILSGGPCSGKSTILSSLKNDKEYRFCCIPEAARELIATGIDPKGDTFSFQRAVFGIQLSNEKNYVQAFTSNLRKNDSNLKHAAVLLDRSAYDGHVYIPDEMWNCILQEFEVSEKKLSNRYDAVILFEVARMNYTVDEERYESYEEARVLADRLLLIYKKSGLPIFLVPETDTIQKKIDITKEIIKSIVE